MQNGNIWLDFDGWTINGTVSGLTTPENSSVQQKGFINIGVIHAVGMYDSESGVVMVYLNWEKKQRIKRYSEVSVLKCKNIVVSLVILAIITLTAVATSCFADESGMEHDVIAEGVEHESQLQYLREHNCDKIQGYLISKPLDEEAAFNFLKNMKKLITVIQMKAGTEDGE